MNHQSNTKDLSSGEVQALFDVLFRDVPHEDIIEIRAVPIDKQLSSVHRQFLRVGDLEQSTIQLHPDAPCCAKGSRADCVPVIIEDEWQWLRRSPEDSSPDCSGAY